MIEKLKQVVRSLENKESYEVSFTIWKQAIREKKKLIPLRLCNSEEEKKESIMNEFYNETDGDIEKYMYCSKCGMYMKLKIKDKHEKGKHHQKWLGIGSDTRGWKAFKK